MIGPVRPSASPTTMSVADPRIERPTFSANVLSVTRSRYTSSGLTLPRTPPVALFDGAGLDDDGREVAHGPAGAVVLLGVGGVVEVHVGADREQRRSGLDDLGGVVARGAPPGGEELDLEEADMVSLRGSVQGWVDDDSDCIETSGVVSSKGAAFGRCGAVETSLVRLALVWPRRDRLRTRLVMVRPPGQG
jgi:hypothetical protein